MSKIVQLKAAARGRAGKGASRAVRREGLIPGVVYGDKQEPQLISVTNKDLQPHVNTGRFLSTLFDLDIDGKVVRAIPRDIQFEPVRDFLVHVDFLRLGANARIAVEVPVHFRNHEASPGLKKGGVLNIVLHEMELYCPADNIPDEVLIDLTGYEIGQSIHISNVKLPANVAPVVKDRDFTIASIASAVVVKEEVPAEAEATAEVPATAQKAPAGGAAAAAPAAGGKAAAPAAGAKGTAAPAAAAPAKKK